MFRKPVFWIVLSLISIGSIIFTFNYFSAAFPLVTLDLKMDRQGALEYAQEIAQNYHWGPAGFRQAASFRLEREVQYFVELEAGGAEAFAKMLEEGLYSPYTWRVRHFKEGETNEVLIRFSPRGDPYGFFEKMPEDEPGASLTSDSARAIAGRGAVDNWQIDLSAYELVEESQEVRPGGRTDHTFVYERPNVQIGEGRYRLRLVVGGNKLIELTHFVKIPEAFTRRHQEMRSANNTITLISFIATAVIYVLGGCVIGLFFLLRQRWVIWRIPLFWGLFIASLQVLVGINNWPLAWMNYDTALSANGFLLRQIIELLATFLFLSILITLSFVAAESLSRRAFPHHIQQWRLWSPSVANSPSILGRTIGGFLLVGMFFGFEVLLYFFTTKVLGWWTPSEALFHPDVLATYFPWFTSIAVSLQAGFWEESLFRAVPIAGAALLGDRFGHRRAWIIAAFIIQALIFGAIHASYPAQPAYARLVELMIPSLAFGALYLYFGLLPAIVLHFVYDVVWFALPLFVSSAPGVWVDQLLVVILALVPLWLVFGARWRSKKWVEISEEDYNRSWIPPAEEATEPKVTKAAQIVGISPRTARLLPVVGLLGLIVWFLSANFRNDAPPLNIGRNDAEELARKTLSEEGVGLSEMWRVLSAVEAHVDQQDRFIWQTGGEEAYSKLMEEYLPPPRWKVRFAQFEGDVAERAEEYQVFIAGKEDVFRLRHQLPEARPGASLTEEDARVISYAAIRGHYRLDPAQLKEVSAVESELPNRRDWLFTFADTANYPLNEGEARIAVKITGDQVADSYRYIHVPEEWAREERNRRSLTNIVRLFCTMVLLIVFLAGVIGAVVGWSRKVFSVRVFMTFFALLFGLHMIDLINGWPSTIARFTTAEPLSNQTFAAIGFSLLGTLFLSAALALVIGFVHSWRLQQLGLRGTRPFAWGLSLGAIAAGLAASVTKFAPSLVPFWGVYSAAGNYLPLLAAGLSPLGDYIALSILFLLIFVAVDRFTQGWTQRRTLFSTVLVLLGLVIAGAGAGSVESLPFLFVSGLISGLVLLLAYSVVLRFHLALIPLALAAVAIFNEVKEGIYQTHPAAIPGSIVAIILIGGVSVLWFRKLEAGR